MRPVLAADPGRGRADEPLGAARQRLALELVGGFRGAGDRLAPAPGAAFPPRGLAESGAASVVVRDGGADPSRLSHVPPFAGWPARGGASLDARRLPPLSVRTPPASATDR